MPRLTEPVVLLRPAVPTRDERGGQIEGVREEIPTLAEMESWGGGDASSGAIDYSSNRRVITVRRNPDVNASWGVVIDGFQLDVKAVLPAGSRRSDANYMRLVCEGADVLVEAQLVGTGPQPVYLQFQASDAGSGGVRETFDVTGQSGSVVEQPRSGDSIMVTSTAGAMLAGNYILLLYPSDWGEPVAVYSGADRGINQLGAFRFVPAELTGSQSDVAGVYTAMVSNNRKATDSELALVLVW